MNKKIIVIVLGIIGGTIGSRIPLYGFKLWPFDTTKTESKQVPKKQTNTNIYANWSEIKPVKTGWTEKNLPELNTLFGRNLVINEDRSSAGYESAIGIRRFLVYTPDQVNLQAKPIALFLVHGTFSGKSEDYFEQGKPLFDAALNFAKNLAQEEKAPVEVISYKWAGYNSHNARETAGQILAQIISNKHFNGYSLRTYAHSHGGNVVNRASQLLGKYNLKTFDIDQKGNIIETDIPNDRILDLIINVGTPILFIPENFKLLLSFYSTGDAIQAFGEFQLGRQHTITKRRYERPVSAEDPEAVYKLTKLEAVAAGYNNMGRIVNIRTQVNGQDPDHSALNAYVLFELPLILTKIHTIYQYNNDLDLNIDQRNIDTALLAIRKPLLADETKELPQAQLETEQKYSNNQAALFKKLYNKDISTKSGLASKTYNILKAAQGGVIPNILASKEEPSGIQDILLNRSMLY